MCEEGESEGIMKKIHNEKLQNLYSSINITEAFQIKDEEIAELLARIRVEKYE